MEILTEKIFNITKQSFKTALWFIGIFGGIGLWRYLATDKIFFLYLFGYIGFSIAVGSFLSASLQKKHKPIGRKITQLMIGLLMIGYLGFVGHKNMQIEGFFFYLFAGILSGATLHYLIAKFVGPIFFGRAWCGWACWTVMIMDFFPWKQPEKGRIKKLGLLRYLHFVLSLTLVSYLFYIKDFLAKGYSSSEIQWLIIGNIAYYALAIILTVLLKDNRAFCKYICPIPVTQKILSRFSIMKQQINMDKCTDCLLCEIHCLMDIKLLDYTRQNKWIVSSECILCDSCVNICPTDAIKTTKRFDVGWKEFINYR